GLMPTDGREHPRHIAGFTRQSVIVIIDCILPNYLFLLQSNIMSPTQIVQKLLSANSPLVKAQASWN
ncbi:MAG: hypothetical protein ACE5GV_11065, partial [Candidatus Scalindua sp.]